LRAAGVPTRHDREIEDAARFFAEDPWGNRLEFVAAKAAVGSVTATHETAGEPR
jgi:hypothetical protein